MQLVKSIDNVCYSNFFCKMNYNIWIGITIAGKAINKGTCKHQAHFIEYYNKEGDCRITWFEIWKLEYIS